MTIQPLTEIPISPLVASIPKAELHIHPEVALRLERLIARRRGRSAYDWHARAQHLMTETPPGLGRLAGFFTPDEDFDLTDLPANDPAYAIPTVVAEILIEAAAAGAVLVEVRYGSGSQSLLCPDFMTLFREAERRAQRHYPHLCAEAIGMLIVGGDPAHLRAIENQLEAALRLADEGLAGLDFIVTPYETEADPALWEIVYGWAERAVVADLGITAHSGEFATANLAAAMRIPGLSRLGHAVYAAADEALLADLAARQITVECCLSSNVVLGGAASYEAHPIRDFVAAGIPVTLNTDDPLRIWTTLGREYALAEALGFSPTDLIGFTRNAINASFTTAERCERLLAEIDQ